MASLMDWLPGLLLLLVMAVIVPVFILLRQRGQRQSWDRLAQESGLALQTRDGDPKMTGMYQGRNMVVEMIYKRSGKQSVAMTRVAVDLKRPVNGNADIHYNQYGMKPDDRKDGRKYYPDMVDTGDPEIDHHFIVRTVSPAVAQTLFATNSRTRELLVSLHKSHPGETHIDGVNLAFERFDRLTDDVKMRHLMDLVSDIADSIDEMN